MKYLLDIEIAVPRTKLVELFKNPDNWPKWQETVVRWEILEGTPGQPGTKTKLVHKFGRREVEMVETVESSDLPMRMTCVYEAKGAWNRVINRFTESGANATRWEFETEFRCSGFLKLMALVVPGMFRKASQKDMISFKRFAESQSASAYERTGSVGP